MLRTSAANRRSSSSKTLQRLAVEKQFLNRQLQVLPFPVEFYLGTLPYSEVNASMANDVLSEPILLSLSLQRVCEGVALHSFHTTVQRLNEVAKGYAARTWGDGDWVERALPLISRHRRKKLFSL